MQMEHEERFTAMQTEIDLLKEKVEKMEKLMKEMK